MILFLHLNQLKLLTEAVSTLALVMRARKQGTKQLIGITHKAPIAIAPSSSIFFFPTTSPLRPQCIWLSHDHVMSFSRLNQQQTTVMFRNKQSIAIHMSSGSFENQLPSNSFFEDQACSENGRNKKKIVLFISSFRVVTSF